MCVLKNTLVFINPKIGRGVPSTSCPLSGVNKLIQIGVHKIVELSSWFSLLLYSTVCHRAESSRRHALVRRSEWAQASQHQTVRSLTLNSNHFQFRSEFQTRCHGAKNMRLIPDYYPFKKIMLFVMSGNNYAAAATVAHSRIFSDNNNSSTGQYLSFPRYYTTIVCYFRVWAWFESWLLKKLSNRLSRSTWSSGT